MGYKRGHERNQVILLPEVIDDFIPQNSYVRFLDDFIEKFDLISLGFTHAISAETGRPPYHPADLLKLYLFGSLNRLNSSRQLAHACKSQLEVMWLLRRLDPDFRTISDFRKENGKAIRKLFRAFVRKIKAMGLVRGETVGVDGCKFAGVNSKDNNYSEKKLTKLIERNGQRMKGYLRRLDKNDSREAESPELKVEIQQQLELITQRQEEKKELLKKLKDSGQKQISTVDPDSRRMKSGDGTVVGYNVQSSVDAENKLIIDIEVTNNGNDSHELEKMATQAKEILEQETLKVAADAGYYRAEEIVNCEKQGIETYVSKPKSPASNYFSKSDFTYSKEEDHYTCPAGEKLTFKGKIREHGRTLRRYQTNACKDCPLRSKCTSRKKGNRRITRFMDEELLETVQKRVDSAPEMRIQRKSIVEHPFGTLKRRTNGRFLTKGIFKVGTEAVLMALAYDLGRIFNILAG
jgi:transposase